MESVFICSPVDTSRALNVEMLKFLFAVLMVLFFWKVYKTFLAMRPYGHRETGIPCENFDESCLVNQRQNEKGELSSEGNVRKWLVTSTEIYFQQKIYFSPIHVTIKIGSAKYLILKRTSTTIRTQITSKPSSVFNVIIKLCFMVYIHVWSSKSKSKSNLIASIKLKRWSSAWS